MWCLACAAYYIYHFKLIQNKEFDIESENVLSHVLIKTESDNTIMSVDINLGHPHFEKEKIPYIPSNPNIPLILRFKQNKSVTLLSLRNI